MPAQPATNTPVDTPQVVLRARDVHKAYPSPTGPLPVLQGIDLEVERGTILAIVGASGAGTRTLLNVLGTLDHPDRGSVEVGGRRIDAMSAGDIAAFNIVSTLFMVVLEKRRDIGVLKSLGAGDGAVLQVFLYQGLLIGGLGVALGLALGGGLIAVLQRYPFVRLPGDVYFIERLPVRPEASDFAAVILATFVLCLVAAIYPAWRASRLDPVEAIRRTG